VDLSNSENYYNWEIAKKKKKDLLKQIEYRKVKLKFGEIPSKNDMNKVYDVLNKNAFKEHYVIIHCTHGNSRTGYTVAYYLCKRFQLKV